VNDPDPVAARRARIARGVRWAMRAGYGALLAAMVAFAVGLATGFGPPWASVTIACLVAACIILPVPIVLGYGIRAAEREDRQARGAGGSPS